MKRQLLLPLVLIPFAFCFSQGSPDLRNQKIDGYRGIWFELNQKYEYGDKYSGGLGTYTAKHIPLAVYSPAADKTFFVYGGTTKKDDRHLLCMAGAYDHKTHQVSKPTVVYDKMEVDDPHDNPTLSIDDEGYLWVFVSGRSTARHGIKLKSCKPLDINEFNIEREEVFTYPQIWKTKNGFFHFFTKYTGIRELYFEVSKDGHSWTQDVKLAGITDHPENKSGHYQVSNQFNDGEIMGTFFNRHLNGHPDTRTDLYYMQTRDNGRSWEDINGNVSSIPLKDVDITERVINYHSQNKNVYLKDMGFDHKGNPACLYLISGGHEPGPKNEPYQLCVTRWTGFSWHTSVICEADHNYDMGSLFIGDSVWKMVAPTESGPQAYGAGGEITIWKSLNQGETWELERRLTHDSELNHSYVRRPINAKAPFCFFWATGDPGKLSKSELYFGDFEGNVWKLPYFMEQDVAEPLKIDFANTRQ